MRRRIALSGASRHSASPACLGWRSAAAAGPAAASAERGGSGCSGAAVPVSHSTATAAQVDPLPDQPGAGDPRLRQAGAQRRRLQKAGQRHTKTMVATDCLAHRCPGEDDLEARLREAGYFDGAAVVAVRREHRLRAERRGDGRQMAGDVKFHRINILDKDFDDIGVGVSTRRVEGAARRVSCTFAVVFGDRDPLAAPPPSVHAPKRRGGRADSAAMAISARKRPRGARRSRLRSARRCSPGRRRSPTPATRRPAPAAAAAKPAPATLSADEARSAIVCLLNEERDKAGLGTSTATSKLAAGGAAPQRPHGRHRLLRPRLLAARASLGRRLEASATWAAASARWAYGENIAWGMAAAGGRRRRSSTPGCTAPPHRANILNRDFREIGVGFAVGTPAAARARRHLHDRLRPPRRLTAARAPRPRARTYNRRPRGRGVTGCT